MCPSKRARARPRRRILTGGPSAAVLITLVPALVTGTSGRSQAIPAFARQHHLSCSACHTHIPQLNEFGRAFLLNNFRVPGLEKDAPLALRKTIPLSIELHAQAHYDNRPAEGNPRADGALDAVLLQGGGLLLRNDAFYVHHHILEDNRPGEVYELWLQHAFNDRNHINLRLGQYEQPIGLSPEILRLTHAGYLVYEAGVGLDDFGYSSPVRGIMLSGGSLTDGVRLTVSVHAPQDKESAHGEPEPEEPDEEFMLTRELNTVFARIEYQYRGKRFGVFGTLGSVDITTPDRTATDHIARIGLDGEATIRNLRVYGLWTTGSNSNPAATGEHGSINGGFIGAEIPLGGHPASMAGDRATNQVCHGHYAGYVQYDRVHVRSPLSNAVNEGPTVGVMAHPREDWAIHLEFQHRRGDHNRVVLATHLAF